jgi:hypothetical protein
MWVICGLVVQVVLADLAGLTAGANLTIKADPSDPVARTAIGTAEPET